MCTRLVVAALAGCLLGLERELRRKAAGVRTIAVICVSSALFTVLSHYAGGSTGDRIASNILTGVGFIGGGVIFRSGLTVDGITTAAVIWASAAIGMAMGLGEFYIGGFTTIIALILLWALHPLEAYILSHAEKRFYAIRYREDVMQPGDLEKIFHHHRLQVKSICTTKSLDETSGHTIFEGKYELTGTSRHMENMNDQLLVNTNIMSFGIEAAK